MKKEVGRPREAEKMVQHLPAMYHSGRFRKYLPVVLKTVGIGVSVLMFISLILYGFSVFYENQVLTLGRQTRSLQEENNDLQIRLDRLRSYQNVAEVSSKVQGLKVATEIIDITQTRGPAAQPQQPPLSIPPKEAYGY